IMPDEARRAGAEVVATGRSDFPNQINNVLVFPGVFRAVREGRLKTITPEMKQAASDALASLVAKPTKHHIIPDPFFPKLAEVIAHAMLKKA
ncbi:MAG: NAD-dependent malic enzyme, partial [Candidatus Levybacteria bacterium]|nr:NAD-dependent malic enzyme [Candidatus Levybacteria bacterium]